MRFGSILPWVICLAFSQAVGAYQFIEIENPDGELVRLKWGSDNMPVPYWVYSSPPDDFPLDDAVAAIQTSFSTWQSIETAAITFQYAGTTSAEPFVFFDFINSLGFLSDAELEGTGILGATNWVFLTFTGEIAESDIFFNSSFDWSVASNGEAGRFDFQSAATHEIGHFLGLGHSHTGVMETTGERRRLVEGSAILFPFAYPVGSILGRTPVADDITGVSALYPAGGFTSSTGILSGSVLKSGTGVFGAHINVFNPFTGETIGFFTDENGAFRLPGLKAGPYVVRVNPITDPTSPEDFGFPEGEVDLDFSEQFYEGRAEIVPGTTTSGIQIEVRP